MVFQYFFLYLQPINHPGKDTLGCQWGLQEIINVYSTEEHMVFRKRRMPVVYPQQMRGSPAEAVTKAAPKTRA